MSGATFSRQAFLARSAMLVGALTGIKAFAPGDGAEAALAPTDGVYYVRHPASIREWWVQSESKKPARIDLMLGDKVDSSYIVPPMSGIYVQVPFGRHTYVDHFRIDDEPVVMERVACQRFSVSDEKTVVKITSVATDGDFMFGAMWEE